MTVRANFEIPGCEARLHRIFRVGAFQRFKCPVGVQHLTTTGLAILNSEPLTTIARGAKHPPYPEFDPVSGPGPNHRPVEYGLRVVGTRKSYTLNSQLPCQLDILQVCPQIIERLVGGEAAPIISTGASSLPPIQKQIWKRLVAAATAFEEGVDHIVDVCTELLLVSLLQPTRAGPAGGSPIDPAVAGANHEALNLAIGFIDANLGQKIEVGDIAKAAKLSPFYFSRLFRAACGVSVHGYVIEKRLQMARHLLATTDVPLTTIALETGFSSQSHLTTMFRERFGTTPGHFRQKSGA